ncbi:MerR family transcriptional regulator [[Clostridium] innocuum]|nr:MerR family transcriptional regulator [[Clostridium] innocuum]
MYKIKELAELYGIHTNALRFYEKKGLLSSRRLENGYRMYEEADKEILQKILLYRAMNFSIADIRELLDNEKEHAHELYFQQLQLLNKHLHELSIIRDHILYELNAMLNDSYDEAQDHEQLQKLLQDLNKSQAWKDRWDFDSFATVYDEVVQHPSTDGLPFYVDYERVLDETARIAAKRGSTVLDIGCGTGNLTERLLRKGLQVVGVDQSLEMLVQAKKKLPSVLLHQGTFLALPFEKQEFDTITASYAFHHCDEEERLLAVREMKRVLRSGGRIIIADLMFADKKARSRYEEQCTARQRAELEDECFTTVEELTQLFTAEEFICSSYQISDSIWIFLAELA